MYLSIRNIYVYHYRCFQGIKRTRTCNLGPRCEVFSQTYRNPDCFSQRTRAWTRLLYSGKYAQYDVIRSYHVWWQVEHDDKLLDNISKNNVCNGCASTISAIEENVYAVTWYSAFNCTVGTGGLGFCIHASFLSYLCVVVTIHVLCIWICVNIN